MNNEADIFSLPECDQKTAIDQLEQGNLAKSVEKRFEILLLKNKRHTNKEIAEKVGVEEHTVAKWIKQYKDEGINSLFSTSGRYHNTNIINNAYNNPTHVVSMSTEELQQYSNITYAIGENNSIDFNQYLGDTVSLFNINLVVDKTTGVVHICSATNIMPENLVVDITSKENLTNSISNMNQSIANLMKPISNGITSSFVDHSCSTQVKDKSEIRETTFVDFTGEIKISAPNNLVHGGEKIYSRELIQAYFVAVRISTYRKGVALINCLFQLNISHSFIQGLVCKEGKAVEQAQNKLIQETLPINGFDPETANLTDESKLPTEMKSSEMDQDIRNQIIDLALEKREDYNENVKNREEKIDESECYKEIYNDLGHSVNISIDEVEVKSQEKQVDNSFNDDNKLEMNNSEVTDDNKETVIDKNLHKSDAKKQKNKYKYKHKKGSNRVTKKVVKQKLKRSVAHIRTNDGEYMLVASDLRKLFLLLLAIILKNNLLKDKQLCFFTDGAKNINNLIKEIFGFRQYYILLDWYHLKHQCYQYFTMGLKGGKENYKKNEQIRKGFYSIIFVGNIDGAKRYLDSIDKQIIKNQNYIDEIKNYLDRKSEYIYCYGLMKNLHLQNSSSFVEKANDLLVANRCKNKAMSWVAEGLSGMTALLYLYVNAEVQWSKNKILYFMLKQLSEKSLRKVERFNDDLQNNAFCA